MLKLLLISILLFGSAFSQDELSEEERYRQEILQKYGSKKEEVIQDSDKDELEKTLEETTEELSNLGGMNAQGEPLEEEPEVSDKNKVQIQDNYLSSMMSSAAKKFITEFLNENPFSRVPKEEMKTLVMARMAGLPFGKAMQGNPRLLDAFVDFLRDKKAIPSILGLVNKPEKVKTFGYISIGIFVLVFILNLFNSKGNIFRRILTKMAIGAVAFTCNMSAFYIIFKDEITPTLNIVFKYFHL